MKIPVFWISWHDDVLARGYADQGFLEEVFDKKVWQMPGIEFIHHEIRGNLPEIDGAIVMMPCRHHTKEVDRFVGELDKLKWSIVFLCGDEEWNFPWDRVKETPTRKVWTMQPIPEHINLSGMVPGGWYPKTRDYIKANGFIKDRKYDFMFAGQVTHIRRELCAMELRKMTNGFLHETQGYMQGIPREEYFEKMCNSKVVPCPSGPEHIDTARTFEALEAGCIPISDLVRPKDPQFDYWKLLFGENMPLPTIYEWSELPQRINELCKNWTEKSNDMFAFWQLWKRNIVKKLHRQICELNKIESQQDLTVIVTTSAIKSHPSTEIIDETIESVKRQLPDAEIIIVADRVRKEQSDKKNDYNEYLQKLLWKCNFEWKNTITVITDKWLHQAKSTEFALKFVDTPLILFVEHDTPLKETFIDWKNINKTILSGEANVIRLHHESSILPDHKHLALGEVETINDIPLVKMAVWWQRPHIASTRFYREKILKYFDGNSRTFIEDKIYGILRNDIDTRGESAWWDWRVYQYAPENMQRSYHIDGRQGEDKYKMKF